MSEELQDTTALTQEMRIVFTAEGATQTDLEGRQLYNSRVRGKDKCMCTTESWVSILALFNYENKI